MADPETALEITLIVIGNALAIFLALAVYAARYKRVPPNKAMIVFGRRAPPVRSGPPRPAFRVIRSGGKFITPIIESYTFLSLEPFTMEGEISDVVVDVRAPGLELAQMHMKAAARISETPRGLELADTNLLDHPPDDLRRIVSMTVEGHTRGILGGGPSSIPDHELGEAVLRASDEDLAKIGLELFTLVLTRRRE